MRTSMANSVNCPHRVPLRTELSATFAARQRVLSRARLWHDDLITATTRTRTSLVLPKW